MALLDKRIGFYAGESVEPFLQQIKKLFLEGKTDREIAEIIKQPRSTIEKAIRSMRDGSAPVRISATEFKNRPAPALSNIARSQEATNRINKAYKDLTKKLGKPPTKGQLAEAANVIPATIRSNTPNLKFTSAAGEGAKATAEMYKKQKVDKPTRTTYEGVKGAKFKDAAQEKRYKEFLEKAAEYPKGSPKNPYDKKFFAKTFNMPETDVESIHKVVREKYNITYPKATDTSASIRAAQLREKSDTGLEQEYTKLKKGERIGNPDLAHRVSKKYNVTTSNLGLDNPLINRVIIKPNERDISRLYDKRIKIENKYKLKDGTFKKPSNADIKILEKINNDVETLARETKGRLSAVINDPTDLNKPYGSLGVDPSKTIGGGIIDVDLKDVRKLSPEDQAFLKLNLLELKKRELNKTPKMIADEFKDVLSKPSVQKRIENIISKGKMETPYIKQSKQILALSAIPDLTTADQLPIPEKSKVREMFQTAFKKVPKKGKLGLGAAGVLALTGAASADELPIKYNDEIGAFVDPKTDDKVSQATLLDWAADNPMPTAAVASAPLLSKTVRKGTGKLLKGLLSTLGSSAAGLTFAGATVKGNLEEGKNIVDATVDPMVGIELLYPEAAKRFGGKGLQNALGRALSLGRVGAMMTPVGIGITALGLGKMGIEAAMDEREKILSMTEEEKTNYLADQYESFGGVFGEGA